MTTQWRHYRDTTIGRMFTPESLAVVKVRERDGLDVFVFLVADLQNADRTGHSWACSREMTVDELARELSAEGLSTDAIAALVERAQEYFQIALGR